MISRRLLKSNSFARKRKRSSNEDLFDDDRVQNLDNIRPSNVPTDTGAALLYLRNIFPVQKFLKKIPPIVLKHQLYSLIKSKTDADRELLHMRDKGEILFFKLSSGMDEYGIVYTSDYRDHLTDCIEKSKTQELALRFVDNILLQIKDVSLDKDTAENNYGLNDETITELMNVGVLLRRDFSSWWISIPRGGLFMKHLTKGRKAILRIIKLRKYKEIPLRELESRNLSVHSKLGTIYHVHDILGAELVMKVDTTTGVLLRYLDLSKHAKRRKQVGI